MGIIEKENLPTTTVLTDENVLIDPVKVSLKSNIEIVTEVYNLLEPYDKMRIEKILSIVANLLEVDSRIETKTITDENDFSVFNQKPSFSADRDLTPKEFLRDKRPQTDVEKAVCLAYYLTHYRDQIEFKTQDITNLNVEAAQLKFANATVAVDNATRRYNFLVPTKGGFKRLSIIGEEYVQALPDREEAKQVITKPKNRKKKKGHASNGGGNFNNLEHSRGDNAEE